MNSNTNILRKYLTLNSMHNKSYNDFYCEQQFADNYMDINNSHPKCSEVNSNLFSERICDDLCEVILSHLSIEDKIRLEAVSKQFQRCIYSKQYLIELKNSKNEHNLYNCLVYKSNAKYINIKAFESLLKKCRFCNEILVKCYFIENKEQVLQTINKSCKYLKSILFDFNEISSATIYAFAVIFGPHLRKLSFVFANPVKCLDNYHLLFRLCPNLVSLYKVKIKHLFAINEPLVPKLQMIDLFYGKTDIKYIKHFVDCYHRSLKSIKISTELNSELLNQLLKEIVHFKQLESLEIWSSLRMFHIDSQFIQSVKHIGSECKKLQRFKLTTTKVNQTIAAKLFESINAFPALKSVDLRLIYRQKVDDSHAVTLKSINNCRQLESIRLNYSGINDRLFKDMGNCFPRLRHMCLTVEQITDKGMRCLSKLSSLRHLCLDVHHNRTIGFPLVTDSGLCDVIYHCPHIESIVFYGRPNITIVTINALILLALSKPKTEFNHYLGFIERKFSTDYTPIELSYISNLPKNLIISTELATYYS